MSLYSHSRATEVHSSDKKWVDIVLTCDLYFTMYFVFPTILFCQPEQYLLIYNITQYQLGQSELINDYHQYNAESKCYN